jgi:hypothetical protein
LSIGPHLSDPILSRIVGLIALALARGVAGASAVLLHDGPDATLKALVAGRDLAQRLEP